MERCPENPIVVPGIYAWRKATVFNPAVVLHEGRFYMLERAAGSLRPHRSSFGLLSSEDGVRFRHVVDRPVFTPETAGWPKGSVQDPRVVKMDDTFYMVYAIRQYAFHAGRPPGFKMEDEYPELRAPGATNLTRSAVATSGDLIQWENRGFCTPQELDDRDVILFPEKINGRFALLRRPQGAGFKDAYRDAAPSIYLSYSDDLADWTEPELVASPRPDCRWESKKIGGAAPPIRTDLGWLTLYHGVAPDNVYRVGAMLLDLEDPARVLARSCTAILEPHEDYERTPGLTIANVVFPCGNVVKDGLLYIYYGCVDETIALATVDLEKLLEHLVLCGGGDSPLHGEARHRS